MQLYEFAPSRSARCRWALKEVGVSFESVNAGKLVGSDELKKVHPLGKLPALVEGEYALFESVAIANFIADKYAYGALIPKAGTWERAWHEQWCSFALTELEAYLWHTAQHSFKYSESERVPAVFPKNAEEAAKALGVLENHLSSHTFLLGDKFYVTDINVGYAINWAANMKMLSDFPSTQKYLDRLYQKPNCTLVKK